MTAELNHWTALIRDEIDALTALLPDALDRQWSPSYVPTLRDDTTERATGGRPADPTAETALDPRRLAVRATVVRSEAVLRDTVLRVRAVRRGLERALSRYDGDEHA